MGLMTTTMLKRIGFTVGVASLLAWLILSLCVHHYHSQRARHRNELRKRVIIRAVEECDKGTLILDNSPFVTDILRVCSNIPRVVHVSIEAGETDPGTIDALTNFPALQSLEVWMFVNCEDFDYLPIVRITSLQRLDYAGDANLLFLRHLRDMPSLYDLRLFIPSWAIKSDEEISKLIAILNETKNIRSLTLAGAKFSQQTAEELQKNLAACKVKVISSDELDISWQVRSVPNQ